MAPRIAASPTVCSPNLFFSKNKVRQIPPVYRIGARAIEMNLCFCCRNAVNTEEIDRMKTEPKSIWVNGSISVWIAFVNPVAKIGINNSAVRIPALHKIPKNMAVPQRKLEKNSVGSSVFSFSFVMRGIRSVETVAPIKR